MNFYSTQIGFEHIDSDKPNVPRHTTFKGLLNRMAKCQQKITKVHKKSVSHPMQCRQCFQPGYVSSNAD